MPSVVPIRDHSCWCLPLNAPYPLPFSYFHFPILTSFLLVADTEYIQPISPNRTLILSFSVHSCWFLTKSPHLFPFSYFHSQTTLGGIQDETIEALGNKNPSVKAETLLFLTRCFQQCSAAMIPKPMLKAFVPVVVAVSVLIIYHMCIDTCTCTCINDSNVQYS